MDWQSSYALIGIVLAAAVWFPGLWRWHRLTAVMAIGFELAAVCLMLVSNFGLWTSLLTLTSVYQLGNLSRIVFNRTQVDYLRRTSGQTGLLLGGLQISWLLLASFMAPSSPRSVDYALLGLGLLINLITYLSTQRHLATTKTLHAQTFLSDRDLPSISVLIPARNETTDLQACLEALLRSDYPKLEIIVLDDCSQGRRTADIIRSFAQNGVRFIAGEQPAANWLAKNFACQQLAAAASGEYLVFCGVDVQLQPTALREFMSTLLQKHKTMISLLPHNLPPGDLRCLFLQPMRYAWELCLPRRFFNRPPVLSSFWIISQRTCTSAGGFKAVSRSIAPESYFARFASRSDGYSFLRSNLLLSSKSLAEQAATSLRLRYPQLRRRPELVYAVSLAELIALVLPIVFLFSSLVSANLALLLPALISYLLTLVTALSITGVMYGRPPLLTLVLAPLAAVVDIALLHYSMYRYEFRDVRWKERNICIPIMRTAEPLNQE